VQPPHPWRRWSIPAGRAQIHPWDRRIHTLRRRICPHGASAHRGSTLWSGPWRHTGRLGLLSAAGAWQGLGPVASLTVRGVTLLPRSAGAWLGSALAASEVAAGRASAVLREAGEGGVVASSTLDCCGILAPIAARARLCAGDGAWPCSVYASAIVGPSGCGAMIFVVVSTFDGVGGVMLAWPEATCLGGC
jgi:hypothetical protein